MPPDPDDLSRFEKDPRLSAAAAQFRAGIAHARFRQLLERAIRQLDEACYRFDRHGERSVQLPNNATTPDRPDAAG